MQRTFHGAFMGSFAHRVLSVDKAVSRRLKRADKADSFTLHGWPQAEA